MEIIKFKFIW